MIPGNCYTSRLYNILATINEVVTTKGNPTGSQVLTMIFDLQPNNRLQMLECWSDITYLVQRAKAEVDMSLAEVENEDIDTFAEIINALVNFPFDGATSNFTNRISKPTMTTLRAYGLMLMRGVKPFNINHEQLLHVKTEIMELVKDVHQSDLPDELNRFLLKHLETIDVAITKYQIWGQDGVVDALNQNIGAICTTKDMLEQNREESRVQRYLNIVKTGTELFNSVTQVGNMIEQGTRLLLGN